jgi:protease-4
VAADQIYTNEGSLVGSIGVRIELGRFGLQKLFEDLGVERRLFTATAHDGIDPFGPLSAEGTAFPQGVLDRLQG